MSTTHRALDAAITRFSLAPGVAPAHVAALRSAIASDAELAQRLDDFASRGVLCEFTIHPNGAQDLPAGKFERASGVLTLPASAMANPGVSGAGSLHSMLRLQTMVIDFAGKSYRDASGVTHPVTQDMLNNFQSTMNRSPVLAQQLKRAAATIDPQQPGRHILESFDFAAPGAGVGGSDAAVPKTTPTTTLAGLLRSSAWKSNRHRAGVASSRRCN